MKEKKAQKKAKRWNDQSSSSSSLSLHRFIVTEPSWRLEATPLFQGILDAGWSLLLRSARSCCKKDSGHWVPNLAIRSRFLLACSLLSGAPVLDIESRLGIAFVYRLMFSRYRRVSLHPPPFRRQSRFNEPLRLPARERTLGLRPRKRQSLTLAEGVFLVKGGKERIQSGNNAARKIQREIKLGLKKAEFASYHGVFSDMKAWQTIEDYYI